MPWAEIMVCVNHPRDREIIKQKSRVFFSSRKKSELEEMEDYPNIQSLPKIVPCETVVQMNEKPSNALNPKIVDGSCLNSLSKGEANIALSCGNTIALMAMSRLIKKPKNDPIAILWPAQNNRGFNILLTLAPISGQTR